MRIEIGWQKLNLWGPGSMVVKINVNYFCTRVCCTRKMLIETETEETIGFFVTFLSLVALLFGEGRPLNPPPGYAYEPKLLRAI